MWKQRGRLRRRRSLGRSLRRTQPRSTRRRHRPPRRTTSSTACDRGSAARSARKRDAEEKQIMPTHYVRSFSFKDSLTDAQVIEELKFLMEQAVPVMLKVNGIRAVNIYSGSGGLR